MNCEELLICHHGLRPRKEKSITEQKRIIKTFNECNAIKEMGVSIFGAGSFARMEIGEKSDLDLFVLAEGESKSRLQKYSLFGNLIELNKKLKFPEFSNDGEYLIIYDVDELISKTGSRRDDVENFFTARMLLMLESFPVINKELYEKSLNRTIENYFRDDKGTKTFKPLFLLNDLLRYWRTLCLNYEERRSEPNRPWRKKNINLRFSRMATVFGTILPLVVKPIIDPKEIRILFEKTPLERLAYGVDLLDDKELNEKWPMVLDRYETFIEWKEDNDVEKYFKDEERKGLIKRNAEDFSSFLYQCLIHKKIKYEYRRYLVL
jgi:predicted nucleotidyltransferase